MPDGSAVGIDAVYNGAAGDPFNNGLVGYLVPLDFPTAQRHSAFRNSAKVSPPMTQEAFLLI